METAHKSFEGWTFYLGIYHFLWCLLVTGPKELFLEEKAKLLRCKCPTVIFLVNPENWVVEMV